MYFLTNRRLHPSRTGLKQLGDELSDARPDEIRVVNAAKKSGKWTIDILPDEVDLTPAERAQLELGPTDKTFASHRVMLDIAAEMQEHKQHLLIYIHGYNTIVEELLESTQKLEKLYGVKVLAFSWPTNDANSVDQDNYRSDKTDALHSAGALARSLAKLKDGFRPLLKDSPFTVNLLAYSMGTYLYENIVKSGDFPGHRGLFTNVTIAASDCDYDGHESWVGKIPADSRAFITLNSRDYTLGLSETVFGNNGELRLGRGVRGIVDHLFYIDFAEADKVARKHNYFSDDDAIKNKDVKAFFQSAFTGGFAETETRQYQAGLKTWRVRRFANDPK